MKAKFLKIAGVKSEKDFYKKYPTEAAFFKAHPEAKKVIKKAQLGLNTGTPLGVSQAPASLFDPVGGTPQGMIFPSTPPLLDINQTGTFEQQLEGSKGAINPNKFNLQGFLGKAAPIAQGLIGGLQANKAEKKRLQEAEQANAVSNIALMASATRPEETRRRYVRPEDSIISPNQRYVSYGTGTNVLAKDGILLNRVMGGNPTEIQNTYAPENTLYDNLGYEPLDESNRLKQFQKGGAMGVLGDIVDAGGGQLAGNLLGRAFNNNAGYQIGSSVGKAVSLIPGVGKVLGAGLSLVGGTIGGLLDKKQKKIEGYEKNTMKNLQQMGLQQGIAGINSGYSSFVRDGGTIPNDSDYEWVSHTWQPQVITHFGEHKLSDLLKEDETMDTLRTGGNIRQNYMYPQDQFNMGGELQTTWGGYAEPISYNPYLPGSGETVMFRGKSHDESDGKGRTGIGVKYGNDGEYSPYMEYGKDGVENVTDVEVERNEPAVELKDADTGDKSLVVYGNLQAPNYALSSISENPDIQNMFKGRTFKKGVSELSKLENKQNKIIDKANRELSGFQPITSMDKLKFDSLTAMMQGANQKLKEYADVKQNAAIVQNAVNDASKEHGVSAEHLAKGLTKFESPKEGYAKNGKKIEKAQDGSRLPALKKEDYDYLTNLYEEAKAQGKGDKVLKFQKEFHRLAPEYAKRVIGREPLTTKGRKEGLTTKNLASNEDAIFGKRTEQYMTSLQNAPLVGGTITSPQQVVDVPGKVEEKTPPVPVTPPNKYIPYIQALGALASGLRRPYQEGLDAAQLYPEMFAMATNQLEPVQAQLYRPELDIPYDISYQDILNQNQADFNAMQRMTGYNPAAQSALSAQKYAANEKVLGEQFRANQAMKAGVYSKNRDILNDAQLKNLQILDNQYVRQAQAKSNTKATTLSALSSIADKIAKNKLENKTFAAYSNMFPQYGFGPDMMARNQGLTFFNIPTVGSTTPEETTDKKDKKSKTAKSGTSLKKEQLKNSMFVKSLKNI